MKRMSFVCAFTVFGTLLAWQLGASVIMATMIGALSGVGLALLLGKSRVFGAITGALLSLFVLAFVLPSIFTHPLRCQFGDPVDLPTLTHPAGYIYVIQDVEFSKRYKIGRTNNPERRLNEIRSILPGTSDIVAIIDT